MLAGELDGQAGDARHTHDLATRQLGLMRSKGHKWLPTHTDVISLQVLSAFCDILECTPAELITTIAENVGVRKTGTDDRPAPANVAKLRPRPARILSDE